MVYMPHWPKRIITHPDIHDLSRILSIMQACGNPHLSLPKTVHIAGTNGKGSTCAMLSGILQYSGYKVHVYTSPHILHFNERIVIGNEIISDGLLLQYLEEIRLACDSISLEPTFFEATTAAAMLAFARHEADFLILETGMGGRLDPTNIIKKPIATLITPISYDHMDYLGHEIGIIAREKSGIIKVATPCIISRQDEKVMDILLEECEKQNAPAIAYEYDFTVEVNNGEGFSFYSRLGDLKIPKFGLAGEHQIINASAVLALTLMLQKQDPNITNVAIQHSMEKAYWRGRIEEVSLAKIVENNRYVRCYLDGAHNVSGAASLAHWIASNNFEKIILIVGLTNNRDVAPFLSQFEGLGVKIYSVPVMSEPCSYSAAKLASIAKESDIEVEAIDSLEEALIEVTSLAEENTAMIITGSLFLIADFYKLKERYY